MKRLHLKVKGAQCLFGEAGRAVCLPDVSVDFDNLLVIKGKIGSGKTMLLKTLGGAVKINEGSVSLTEEGSDKELSGYFVHSQAEFNFVTGLIGNELEFAGIDPKPFSEYLKRDVNELSGGELKRISVMMAIQADSNIILFDEPLDMLDDEQSEIMAGYIAEKSKEKPVIVATHDDHFDKYTGNIIRIDSGEEEKPIRRLLSTSVRPRTNLSVTDLSVRVEDRVFPEINLTARPGEIVCLYGKNGSGKTLFTRTVAGIGRWEYSGNYEWFVNRGHTGICLQFPEQMAYQEKIEDEIADTAGEENIDAVLDILNWQSRRMDSPFCLSDGEKRTMYLIALLVKNTACVFDEPFAGLDQHSTNFIVDYFYKVRQKGAGIIYTANRMKDTSYADRVIKIG